MNRRELLGTAQIPGGGTLELHRHDRDFMIMLGNNELMSSRKWGSEVALAELTLDRLDHAKKPHLLIGGYGMGFTLRAALARLDPAARVTVTELVPEIIEWARGPMADLAAGCLDDPRIRLELGDVGETIAKARREYDAILLDVDNGPHGIVRDDNNGLYSRDGLAMAAAALRPGGVLAVWSAGPDPEFTRHLKRAGYKFDEVKVAARSNGKGAKHTIWLATPRLRS